MKLKLLAAVAFAAALYSCDDSTSGVGDFVSGIDKIDAFSRDYYATSKTVLNEKVYARTNRAYLGKYTDPDFGEFTADFITQINCPDNFEFPENTEEIVETVLEFTYTSFYGDSLANLTLQVDKLNKFIGDNESTDRNLYYTNYNPEDFYDKGGSGYITHKTYAVADHSISDSIKNKLKVYYHDVELGDDFSKHLLEKYVDSKDNFKDSYTFIRNVLPGFYVHIVEGEGSVIYIDDISLRMKVKYLAKSHSTGAIDSTAYAYTRFSASKEVLTSTRMENSSKLQELADETNDKENKHTYIKTPAGLYTELTLPIEEMYGEHQNDTLNSVTMSIKKYRYAGSDGDNHDKSSYEIGVPQNLLMVRADDYTDFFEKNKIYDDKTSFLATYDKQTNSYSFSKLNRLISHIFAEKRDAEKNGKELSENWDKVLLIPVTTDVEQQQDKNVIIGISNDLSVSAARLFGGVNGDKIEMEVTYTKP